MYKQSKNKMEDWDVYSISSNDETTHMCQLPYWVTLEPIEFQILWQNTAGKRPIQPPEERAYYEKIWKQNSRFIDSSGNTNNYDTNIKTNKYTILSIRSFEGFGPFGIQITHFKVINNKAYYLVKFKTPTYEFCTWNTYTTINNFYKKTIYYEKYTYTRMSWNTWKYKQSWHRNTSINYLTMKAFLLERILQDALYESKNSYFFYKFFT